MRSTRSPSGWIGTLRRWMSAHYAQSAHEYSRMRGADRLLLHLTYPRETLIVVALDMRFWAFKGLS